MNDKISKNVNFAPYKCYNHTCGSDARASVVAMKNVDVTLTVCYDLVFLRFCLPKIRGGGLYKISSQLVKTLSFDHF